MKQESKTSRLRQLEDETKTLQNELTNCMSVITSQTAQLARQDKMMHEIRDELKMKANSRAKICWIIMLVVAFFLISIVWVGYPTMAMIGEDTTLNLNVKATPMNAPFITAGVKVKFSMGDLLSCVKGAFSGNTIGLSLT